MCGAGVYVIVCFYSELHLLNGSIGPSLFCSHSLALALLTLRLRLASLSKKFTHGSTAGSTAFYALPTPVGYDMSSSTPLSPVTFCVFGKGLHATPDAGRVSTKVV